MKKSRYIVLLFHSTDDRNLLSLKNLGNIRPGIFEKICIALKREFEIISLEDMIDKISGREEEGEGRFLAVTFDDGPKSYALRAVPIMESHGIPSTCFLITDCIGDRDIYWRYLYNFCLHAGFGRELADLVKAEYGVSVADENIVSFTRSNYSREKTSSIIHGIFRRIIPEEEYRQKEGGLFLSPADIGALKTNPLVSFGIHTRSHPVLSRLSDDEISDEISGSLAFHKKNIQGAIPMLSIPFGRLGKDYDERAILAARNHGIRVVLSAYGGDNRMGQPLYNMRRIAVHEEMFENENDFVRQALSRADVSSEYIEQEKRFYRIID